MLAVVTNLSLVVPIQELTPWSVNVWTALAFTSSLGSALDMQHHTYHSAHTTSLMMLRQAQYCDLHSSTSIVFHLQSTLLPLALT